ncbi:MAG: tyrosine-type recombinase/integrase [bacterium]
MKREEKAFVGEFNELLESFVKQKIVLGYKYDATRDSLKRFSHYTLNYRIDKKSLSKELVLSWTARRKNESDITWAHRSSDLRQFALYLQSHGYDAFIPPKCHKIRRHAFVPYIFTQEEIQNFMRVVDSIAPHPRSNKNQSYPLLFRLLYCCGLRITESLQIKISDVDSDKGTLLIREAKFGKDRILPLSPSLASMFVRYHGLFNKNKSADDYYFTNKGGTPVTRDRVYKVYRQLLWKVGISHGGKGKGPRLHDLRHTFCVHTLAKQVKAGVDLYVALPILSVYLGHCSVRATQGYVRLTAEAYPDLIEEISRTCAHVLPEVTINETH